MGLLVLIIYCFNIESSEVVFAAFIYDYARCSDYLRLDTQSSSLTLTLFSAAMMVGRFFGIFLAKRISAKTYSLLDLLLATAFISFMAINSLKEEVNVLIFTSFYGLGISTV